MPSLNWALQGMCKWLEQPSSAHYFILARLVGDLPVSVCVCVYVCVALSVQE